MLNTRVNLHSLTDVRLAKYKIWDIDGDRRGDVISCLDGTLWITQEGDLNDYILDKGQDFWVTRRGTLVVQALENSLFKFSLNALGNHIESNIQPARPAHRVSIKQHLR